MEAVLQIAGSLLLFFVYLFYLKQTIKGESTPNPGTWIIWFVIMGINSFTYLKVVNDDILKTAIVFVSFFGISSIMLYSLIQGKFAKLAKIDWILLILSVIIGIFWQISENAKLSNLFLQIIILISFFPTAIGLTQNRLKERHWPWTLAVIAYILQTVSLLIDYDGNLYQLFLPVINGILGNGLILVIIFKKRWIMPFINIIFKTARFNS